MAEMSGQVAVLIDFENLVRGSGEDESIDCEVLIRLAEEYGRVLVANAYADWRWKDVNQYQLDLVRLGVDLVHVFGKTGYGGFKNAVDVKMAVDAVSSISSMPHLDTYVIVSGDRDFIHLLKELRRHGKMVIGVSPSKAASNDFAALCDRFVRYESLLSTFEGGGQGQAPNESSGASGQRPGLDQVRDALRSILSTRPDGLKGAMIKPMLRRELSPSFDESDYGFSRLSDLLVQMNDVVRIVLAPDNGGDITVYPVDTASAEIEEELEGEALISRLIQRANLKHYRYERNRERRHEILKAFFEVCRGGYFTWEQVQKKLLEEESSAPDLSVTQISRYLTALYQARAFEPEHDHQDLPLRQRSMRLRPEIETAEDLVKVYEGNVVYKVVANKGDIELSTDLLCEVLGLDPDDEEQKRYCRDLVAESKKSLVRQHAEA